MIAFRLDHMLHMQYDQMIQALLDGWEMGSIYVIRENEMIFPLKNEQIRAYSFAENSLTKPQVDEELQTTLVSVAKTPEEDADYLLKAGSDATEIFKFLLLLIRRVYELTPHADKHMTQVLLAKLNKRLENYKLQIGLDRDEYIMPTFLLDGEIVSLEKAMEAVRTPAVTQVQKQTTEVVTKSIVQYIEVPTMVEAPRTIAEDEHSVMASEEELSTSSVGQEAASKTAEIIPEDSTEKTADCAETSMDATGEPAVDEANEEESVESKPEEQTTPAPISDSVRALFESALNGAKPGSEVYHSICFAMGEIMYYRDELESAIYFYEKCEIDRIEDKEDFYERLGHCYLDDKMDAFASVLKLIYRAEHNDAFRESHKEELEKCPHFSQMEISAYREKCISLGEEMYGKKANS